MQAIVYFADVGERGYRKRRAAIDLKRCIGECLPFIAYLEGKGLGQEKRLPDAVAGEVCIQSCFDYIPSTKTLYNWIDSGLCCAKKLDLPLKVKHSEKSPRVRAHKRLTELSIDERPDAVDRREEAGHWERGRRRRCTPEGISDFIGETQFRQGYHFDVKDRDSSHNFNVAHSLKEYYGNNSASYFIVITFDNGSEFSSVVTLYDEDLKIDYSHPYTSVEHPVNENWNGIVRRFLPKGGRRWIPAGRLGYTHCQFDLLPCSQELRLL